MAAKTLKEEVTALLTPNIDMPDPEVLAIAAAHADAPLPTTHTVVQAPLGELVESPTNPRKTFAAMDRLIESVKAAGGVMVPLIVRPHPEKKGMFEIVAGHRRYRAAKAAKIKTVPCDVRTLDDTQVLEIQITENLQRSDLNEIEEAETFGALHQQHGYTVEQIAKKIGVSIATVYSRLKMLNLAAEARVALAEGRLPSSVSVPLARLPHGLQAKALKTIEERYTYDNGVHTREAIEFIQRDFCRSLKAAPFSLTDSMLVEGVGACKTCPKNSKQGTPGLFDDLKGSGAFCTDVACFRQKANAAWEAVAKEGEAKGARVLTLEEGAKIYAYGTLGHDSKYTELDAPNHADQKRRHWREFYERIPAEQRPQLVIIPDRDQAPHEVVEAQALVDALAASTAAPKWAKAEVERKEELAAARAEARVQNKEAAKNERIAAEAVKKIGAGLKELDAPTMRFILYGLADRWVPQGVLDALECEDRDAYEKKVLNAPAPWLNTALLFFGAFSGGVLEHLTEGFPAPFKALAKAHGVDLKAIEKAIDAGDAAEALMTKPKKGSKS